MHQTVVRVLFASQSVLEIATLNDEVSEMCARPSSVSLILQRPHGKIEGSEPLDLRGQSPVVAVV